MYRYEPVKQFTSLNYFRLWYILILSIGLVSWYWWCSPSCICVVCRIFTAWETCWTFIMVMSFVGRWWSLCSGNGMGSHTKYWMGIQLWKQLWGIKIKTNRNNLAPPSDYASPGNPAPASFSATAWIKHMICCISNIDNKLFKLSFMRGECLLCSVHYHQFVRRLLWLSYTNHLDGNYDLDSLNKLW